jgi:hypothetical protein
MERAKKDPRERFALVLGRLRDCEDRIKNLLMEGKIRDIDEIWEAYCVVEEGIALSNFALGAFDRLGKRRKLTVSAKDDPLKMSEDDLRKKYSFVQDSLARSLEQFITGAGEAGAESARKARDVLKTMLIACSDTEKRESRRVRTSTAKS